MNKVIINNDPYEGYKTLYQETTAIIPGSYISSK